MKFRAVLCLLLSVSAGFILLPTPAHATFPGKNGRIVFVQDGQIFTINPDGSDVKQLTHLGPDNSANWPAWSADGKQIVFNEFPPPDGKAEIWLMDADGGHQRRVLAERYFDENRPSLSPDGSKVVFGRCKRLVGDGDTCAIHTVNLDGSGLTRIVPYHFDDSQRSPMFSPDGRTIAFIISPDVSHGFQGVTYLVNADGTNLRRITPPAPCLIRPDWSPDGSRLTLFAHLCNPQNETIAVMNADGSDLRYLTNNGSDFYSNPHDRNPAWSPQGDFIVFERDAPDYSSSDIYLIRPDGSEAKAIARVTHAKRAPSPPSRAPKPRKIEDGGSIPRWGVAVE